MKRSPISRRTPMKRVRSTPRRVSTWPPELQCVRKRCTSLRTVLDWCGKHAREEADRLFSLYIRQRDGGCQVCGLSIALLRGDLQCMHGVSRRKFATRWDPANSWAGCSRCHLAMTLDPNRWHLWMEGRIGTEALALLRFKAERGGKPDVGWVIQDLRAKLEEAA